MGWAKVGGIALAGLSALLILRSYKPEWAALLRMAVTVVSLGLVLSMAGTAVGYVSDLTAATGALEGDSWLILLKSLDWPSSPRLLLRSAVTAGRRVWPPGWRRRESWRSCSYPFP